MAESTSAGAIETSGTAGGYSDTADRNRAIIYRPQGKQMVKGIVGLDFPIYPGDTIVISERWL